MKPVPIYDDTVPIACTAGREGLPARVEQIERLRTHHTGLERTADGILLHLPNRPEAAAEVASFTIEEKACCAFWGFAVTTAADTITLRWDGPASVSELFDALARYFEGDRPLSELSGLL